MPQTAMQPVVVSVLKCLLSLRCVLSRSFPWTGKFKHTHTHTLLLELWVDVVQVPLKGFALELLAEFHSASDTGDTHTNTQTSTLKQTVR